jgi:hypothetical protein
MAVTVTVSNHFKYQKDKGLVDMSADVFKAILMNSAFAFDKDAHATLANVTASQISTGYGYTQDDMELENPVTTEDDSLDAGKTVWDDVVWTAAGGSIGPAGAMIIYDDTTSDDTIYCCVDFGVDYTIPDTASIEFNSLLGKTT